MNNYFLAIFGAFVLFFTQSCGTVSPNMYILYTNDCWNHTTLAKSGDVMPQLETGCNKIVALPSYQMPGSVIVKTRFKNDVKGQISIDYLYQITDPLIFVTNAKFILQSNAQADDYNKENTALELAENTITDKIIKDIVRSITENMDAANFNESEFEANLEKEVNRLARDRGTVLSAFSIKVDFGKQTEEAIDAASAYGLYKANGMEKVGEEIMKANAGKPEIIIQQEKQQVDTKE